MMKIELVLFKEFNEVFFFSVEDLIAKSSEVCQLSQLYYGRL